MTLWNSTFKISGKPMQRSPWKKRAPKKRSGHNKSYLLTCRGEPCYLRFPGICVGGTATTVPAHSNELVHGKGMGIKADDKYTVPACYACHAQHDQGRLFTKAVKFARWRAAYAVWEPVRGAKLKIRMAA